MFAIKRSLKLNNNKATLPGSQSRAGTGSRRKFIHPQPPSPKFCLNICTYLHKVTILAKRAF